MKALFSSFTAIFFCCSAFSQVILYTTDFGATAGVYPAGWTSSNVTNGFAASTVSASAGYTGASGLVNARFLNTGTTGAVLSLTYNNNLSTVGYTSVRVSWACRTTATFTQPVTLEWSADGTNWNVVAFTQAPANTDWSLANGAVPVLLPAGAANIPNLRLRWSVAVSNDGNYQIDDLTVDGLLLTGGSAVTDYFRSRLSGDWGLSANWESSPDNVNWITATLIPTSTANTIRIRNGHVVTIGSNMAADQLIIDAGGTLSHPAAFTFTLDDGAGDDMQIDGTYIVNGSIPAGTGTYVVNNGAVVRANANTGSNSDDLAFASNTRVLFRTGSAFEWNTSLPFNSSGYTYFSSATEKPVFRITANVGAVGGALNTVINGLLEVNATVTFDNAGLKIFRDGITGTGTLNQGLACGAFQVNGTDAELGGTGTINVSNGGLQIVSPAIVNMVSNKIINGTGFNFTVGSGSRLNCFTFIVSGTAGFVLAASGTLGIGSPAGITSAAAGNIQTAVRSYNSGANYIYNGNANQVTGSFNTTPVANTVNAFTIANTGAAGNNTVTLTINNTTTSSLFLNNGFFAAGTNQTLRIANAGNVYGNGANNPNNATAGAIEFLGSGSTHGFSTGNPFLYSVVLNTGTVDFNGATTHSATILSRLQLNGNAVVAEAPYYTTGSFLIYNTGGPHARSIEWSSLSNQGYPYHVVVQGGTVLNLNTNAIGPARLEIAGSLFIGNASGRGEVHLNAAMIKPLSVLGDLVIGETDVAAAASVLSLSSSAGGDLWLNGNFTRHNTSFYTDNGRAVIFKGATTSSVNTVNIPITPGVPTQFFSGLVMEKTTASALLILNCPVSVTIQLTLLTGVITTTSAHLLEIENTGASTSGSVASFVNGPLRKKGGTAFVFPTGKIVGSEYHHRTIGITATGNSTGSYIAEFYRSDANLLGSISNPAKLAGLQRVSRCEYWRLSKEAGSDAGVVLSWSSQSPCNSVYVTDLSSIVAAQFNGSNWGDVFGGSASGSTTAGIVTWAGATAFNYFALGSNDFLENPLPLDVSGFRATAREQDVALNWMTATNDEQVEFLIEKSRNGSQFIHWKAVPVKTLLFTATYNELDKQPFVGWNYYRLRVLDKLGKERISHIVKVWYGADRQIRITPNPAVEKIIISFSDPRSISEIAIVNISGQVLKRISTVQFNNEINISHLQAGMYYVRIMGKNGLTTTSFIKQ